MKRFLIICLLLVAVSLPASVSAFVDRNDVSSAAQFKDYVPASYLKKAGVTDEMTVDQALDAYITYALSFSDKTAYAYIAALSNPAQVKIRTGGSTVGASRGDVVAGGWGIEVGDDARIVIRYPGGVTHTITGPYTYTVPAYGDWGTTATFGTSPVSGKNSKAFSTIPDTTGYAIVTKEIQCRGTNNLNAIPVAKVTGTVYAVHYSQNPKDPEYFSFQVQGGSSANFGDTTTLVIGPGSSATIDDLDLTVLSEKTMYKLEPRFSECVTDTDPSGKPTGKWREKTLFDTILLGFGDLWNSMQEKVFEITRPTAVAGVRG